MATGGAGPSGAVNNSSNGLVITNGYHNQQSDIEALEVSLKDHLNHLEEHILDYLRQWNVNCNCNCKDLESPEVVRPGNGAINKVEPTPILVIIGSKSVTLSDVLVIFLAIWVAFYTIIIFFRYSCTYLIQLPNQVQAST